MGAFTTLKNFFEYRFASDRLVDELISEHKALIAIYNKLHAKLLNNDFESVLTLLNKLFLQYKKHVLREDSLFYAKLFKKYKGYDTIIHGIKEVREELNDLTMKFERFVALYSSVEAIKNKLRAFVNDIEHLGEALKERMEFEEKRLYILY